MFDIGIPEFAELCSSIKAVMNLADEIDVFLAGWQFNNVREKIRGDYKKAVLYGEYLRRKAEVDITRASISCKMSATFRIK